MDFAELADIRIRNADTILKYMVVYDSVWQEGRDKNMPDGDVGTITRTIAKHTNSEMLTISAKGLKHSMLIPSVVDSLVVTAKIKKERRGEYLDVSAKCIYPLVEGSPYYEDEELFEAKLSGDYRKLYKKLRKAFNAWKKEN